MHSYEMRYLLVIVCISSSAFILLNGISAVFGSSHPSFLKVIVLVNNTGGGTAQPSDFMVNLGYGAQPSMIYGSSKGIVSNVGQGTLRMMVFAAGANNKAYALEFSGDCTSTGLRSAEVGIQPGDKKTCIITATYPNFD
jgi:hypothetical protein